MSYDVHRDALDVIDDEGADRTRTFTWSDPTGWRSAAGRLTGREQLEEMVAGRLPEPPIARALGFDGFEVGDGWVTVSLEVQEFHYNPVGSVHGGVIATILDTAAACAVQTTLAAGEGQTSLDLNVKFLRAVTVGSGLVRAHGQVLHRGARTAVAEARLVDGKGVLLAQATSTLMLFGATG